MVRKIALVFVALVACVGCKGTPSMSRGGIELVYDVASTGTDDARATALADGARKVAAARLQMMKIPAVVRVDGRKVRVGLPKGDGTAAVAEAKALLATGGVLELREIQDAQFLKEMGKDLDSEGPIKVTQDTWTDVNGAPRGCFMVDSVDDATARKTFPKDKLPSGVELMLQQGSGAAGEHLVYLAVGAPLLTNEAILFAKPLKDPVATPATIVKLSVEGTKKFEEVTEKVKGKKLGIVLDGKITSAPVIMMSIANGELQIPQPDVGDRMARVKASDVLAAVLTAGAMPALLTLAEERQVER